MSESNNTDSNNSQKDDNKIDVGPETPNVPAPVDKLTDKQELFCQYYVRSLNAGYSAVKSGYSEDSKYVIGTENLRKPLIKARIKQLLIENVDDELLEDVISSHLKNLMTFNISDLMDEKGNIDPIKIKNNELPGILNGVQIRNIHDPQTGKVISSEIKIKAIDQLNAIEKLMKLKKMYSDGPTNTVNIIYADKDDEKL